MWVVFNRSQKSKDFYKVFQHWNFADRSGAAAARLHRLEPNLGVVPVLQNLFYVKSLFQVGH